MRQRPWWPTSLRVRDRVIRGWMVTIIPTASGSADIGRRRDPITDMVLDSTAVTGEASTMTASVAGAVGVMNVDAGTATAVSED